MLVSFRDRSGLFEPVFYDIDADSSTIYRVINLFKSQSDEKKNFGTIFCFESFLRKEKIKFKELVPALSFVL